MQTELALDDIVETEVTRITDFGAFVKINGRGLGLIHISQVSDTFVKNINEHLKVGDKVKARIIKLGPGRKVDLSLKTKKGSAKKGSASFSAAKKKSPYIERRTGQTGFKASDLEEKLEKFLQKSR